MFRCAVFVVAVVVVVGISRLFFSLDLMEMLVGGEQLLYMHAYTYVYVTVYKT